MATPANDDGVDTGTTGFNAQVTMDEQRETPNVREVSNRASHESLPDFSRGGYHYLYTMQVRREFVKGFCGDPSRSLGKPSCILPMDISDIRVVTRMSICLHFPFLNTTRCIPFVHVLFPNTTCVFRSIVCLCLTNLLHIIQLLVLFMVIHYCRIILL